MKLRNLITEDNNIKGDFEFSLEGLMELFNQGAVPLDFKKIGNSGFEQALYAARQGVNYTVKLSKDNNAFEVYFDITGQFRKIKVSDRYGFDLDGVKDFKNFIFKVENYIAACDTIKKFNAEIDELW